MDIRHGVHTLLPAVLLFISTEALANVTGIVRGVQENLIAGALVTFINEQNPADTYSGYTNAAGRYDIAISALGVGDVVPAPFTLDQNHPNPFNPTTTITFTTAEPGVVTLAVYNLLGQRVRTLVNGTVPAGEHAAVWDGLDDAGTPSGAGVYLYRLAAGGKSETRKMLLIDGGAARGWAAPISAPQVLKTASVTWTVTITSDDIEPREMNGLEIADGGTYDFYVIYTVEPMNFHLVQIPGGTFEMGDDWADFPDDSRYYQDFFGPAHLVTLSDFEISAYETTNIQYAQFLNEALAAGEIEMINGDPYGMGGEWNGKRYIDLDIDIPFMKLPNTADLNCLIMFQNGSFKVEEPDKRNWPVVGVTWYGAKAFAVHYGLDLPREAEWEYAAGGGTLEYDFATDNGTIDATKANYHNTIGHPVEVGSYLPNPFGLYDMTGNIEEWCNDWFGRYPSLYDETSNWNDRNSPPSYPLVNPIGPTEPDNGTGRIIRGGYYSYGKEFIIGRTTGRNWSYAEATYSGIDAVFEWCGFRVARRQ